jgi:hypothetical protein
VLYADIYMTNPNEKYLGMDDLIEEEIDGAVGSEELLNDDAPDTILGIEADSGPADIHGAPETLQ